MKTRILFVDDDQSVLEGLERLLCTMSEEWDPAFVQSAEQALSLMQKESFDAIVTDMRMPGMDGAELLREVKRIHPQTIRFVLSGHASDESALRSAGLAHQYMDKPCSPQELEDTLMSALSLRKMLSCDGLKALVTSLGALPSLSQLYGDLIAELNTPDPSIKVAAKIVSQDVAMSAKVLQLVNSAFFGLRAEVTNLTQAASLLGLETLKSLVLAAHAFSEDTEHALPPSFSLSELSAHSVLVATWAKAIAQAENCDEAQTHEAFTAGLLHDVGKLVLAVNRPQEYEHVCVAASEEPGSSAHTEHAIFGATHGEVGAYLLGLWGLPDAIVNAVAYHHAPLDYHHKAFTTLTAVHAADAFVCESESPEYAVSPNKLDTSYIGSLGLAGRIHDWRAGCALLTQEVQHA